MKRRAWLALAICMGGCTSEKEHLNAEWKKTQADAAAAKVPLRPGQVLEGVSVPSEQNAALALRTTLAKTLNPPRPGQPDMQPVSQPVYSEAQKAIQQALLDAFLEGKQPDYPALKRALVTLDPILKEAEKALAKPGWDFQRPWSEGISMLMPDFAREKALAKWFAAKAMVAAHEGKDREAEQAIAAIYRIGYHLRTEPLIIGVLVAEASDAIGDRAILDVAKIKPGNKALLKRLMSLLQAEKRPINWRNMWFNENAMTLDSLKYSYGKDAKPEQAQKAFRAKVAVGRLLVESQTAWGQPPYDLAKLREVSQKFEKQITAQFISVDKSYGEGLEGDGIFGPLIGSQKTVEASRRASGLTLATVIVGPPWKLPSQATKDQWLDPYSHKPMHFRQDGKGFAIYSVGEDHKDNGGSQKRDAKDRIQDIVISYPNRHKAEASKSD